MTAVRDLTEDELNHGLILARKWQALSSRSDIFGLECEQYATNGRLSRGQYDRLKKGPDTSYERAAAPRWVVSNRMSRNKRPITLPPT